MTGERSNTTSRPLSCHHCRKRKVACDKVLPCQPCQYSGLTCVFPSGRKQTSKSGNGELLRRIARLEQLIVRSGIDEEKPSHPHASTRQDQSESEELVGQNAANNGARNSKADTADEFVGHSFLKSLANEIGLMKDMVEDDSTDEEEWNDLTSIHRPDLPSAGSLGFSVSDADGLRRLHPSTPHALQLCTLYASNVDPIFKILHIPAMQRLVRMKSKNPDHIPPGEPSTALLFAIYYSAITTLTEKDCLATFENGKETLLAQYRTGVENGLANADFIRKPHFTSLQALTIFMVALRANNSTRLAWALFAIAVRLGQALGLHRESSLQGLSVFDAELRRRLWWQLIILDGRFAPDLARDRLIVQASFNVKKPLNINDIDMNESTKTLVERRGLTEMTKCRLTHDVFELAWRLQPDDLPGQEAGATHLTTDQKMEVLAKLEQLVTDKVFSTPDTSTPMAWANRVIGHITIRRARLIVYYPLHNSRQNAPPKVSKAFLLLTAVECMEYCNLIEKDPISAPWRWFSNHAPVYWYGLAATLAGLCVQTTGPLVDRAWAIIDLLYDDWSARLAKSGDFKVWRPISKLRKKAQAQRNKALLDNIRSTDDGRKSDSSTYHVQHSTGDFQDEKLDPGLPGPIPPPGDQTSMFDPSQYAEVGDMTMLTSTFDADFPSSEMDWAEWDQFAQDIRMEGS